MIIPILNLIGILSATIASACFSQRPFVVLFLGALLMILMAVSAMAEKQNRWLTVGKLLLIPAAGFGGGSFVMFLLFFCLDELPPVLTLIMTFVCSFSVQMLSGEISAHGIAQNMMLALLVTAGAALLLLAKHLIRRREREREEMHRKMLSMGVSEMNVRRLNRRLAAESFQTEKNARLLERENISRNIHNSVGHSITAAIMTLDAADMLYDSKPDEARKRMNDANERIRGSLENIRSAVRALDDEDRETSIPDFEIYMDNIISEFVMDTSLTVDKLYDIYSEEVSLPREHAEFLTGVLEELLTNGVKHGKATAFMVKLMVDSAHVQLSVKDNGNGDFSPDNREDKIRKGFGLKKIESYVNRCGGSCRFENEDGFFASVELPITV